MQSKSLKNMSATLTSLPQDGQRPYPRRVMKLNIEHAVGSQTREIGAVHFTGGWVQK